MFMVVGQNIHVTRRPKTKCSRTICPWKLSLLFSQKDKSFIRCRKVVYLEQTSTYKMSGDKKSRLYSPHTFVAKRSLYVVCGLHSI